MSATINAYEIRRGELPAIVTEIWELGGTSLRDHLTDYAKSNESILEIHQHPEDATTVRFRVADLPSFTKELLDHEDWWWDLGAGMPVLARHMREDPRYQWWIHVY